MRHSYRRQIEKQRRPFNLRRKTVTRTQLSDYRGKVVLLNFWATDCGGCVLEIPSIIQIENAYKPQGFTALGVLDGHIL